MAGHKQRWEKVRALWESDPREGFAWLIKEINYEGPIRALTDRAKREKWKKTEPKPASQSERAPEPARARASQDDELEEAVELVVHDTIIPISDPAMPDLEYAKIADLLRPLTGPRTKYHQCYVPVAQRLAMLGCTLADFGEIVGVAEATVETWTKRHPEFGAAWRAGRRMATSSIATRLYQRAMGYTYEEVHVKVAAGRIHLVRVPKHVPPDVEAAKIVLFNREPELWKNRVEVDQTHHVDPADIEALQRAHDEALAHAEQQRAAMLGRSERLGLTFENEDGAWSETDEPLPIGDDDMTEENP
jgi:hypothetical protein